jgi:1-deoxy-D-xylulose-5-phosphate synthase
MAASDEAELMHMVATAAAHDSGPIAFRYPRGNGMGVEMPERGEVLEIGKGRVLQRGSDVAFLSLGAHLGETLEAAALLEADGVSATVADARFAKPLDTDLLMELAQSHDALVVVEEGAQGGFGSMVLHELAARGAFDAGLKVRCVHLPDRFIDQASPSEMYADAEMSAQDLATAARKALGHPAKVVRISGKAG